jgi:uncharacterized protein YqgQ
LFERRAVYDIKQNLDRFGFEVFLGNHQVLLLGDHRDKI